MAKSKLGHLRTAQSKQHKTVDATPQILQQ